MRMLGLGKAGLMTRDSRHAAQDPTAVCTQVSAGKA